MAGKRAPANETAAQRFIRIANGRHSKIVTGIEGLGNLVGSSYESNSSQHKKLFDDIRSRLDAAEKALAANKAGARDKGGIL